MPPMTLHSAPADQHSRELLERLHRLQEQAAQLPARDAVERLWVELARASLAL